MFQLVLAQIFAGLTATYDGGVVYFTTSLRLKGEDFTQRSRIYSYSAGNFRLVYALPQESLHQVTVSEDGRTLIAHMDSGDTLLIRDGDVQRLKGHAHLSRNGRFLLLRNATGISLRNLDTGEPMPIPEKLAVPLAPSIADDGRLTAGTPVCPETYLNPAASHAIDVCIRYEQTPIGLWAFCEGYIRDVETGATSRYSDVDCRPMALSNEWLALPSAIISLRQGVRYPGTGQVQAASITADEQSILLLDRRGELYRRNILIPDARHTLLPVLPWLSPYLAFAVPGSMVQLSGFNLPSTSVLLATPTHTFPALVMNGGVTALAPSDLPLGSTTIRLELPGDVPFEPPPTPFHVYDWQPSPIAVERGGPGEITRIYLTGLRESRPVTAVLRVGPVNWQMPLSDVRATPSPGRPGLFFVEVLLPPVMQLPAPLDPSLRTIPIEIEIGPPGPLGAAKVGFPLQVRD